MCHSFLYSKRSCHQGFSCAGTYRAKRLRILMRTLLTQKHVDKDVKLLTGTNEKSYVPLPPDVVSAKGHRLKGVVRRVILKSRAS